MSFVSVAKRQIWEASSTLSSLHHVRLVGSRYQRREGGHCQEEHGEKPESGAKQEKGFPVSFEKVGEGRGTRA